MAAEEDLTGHAGELAVAVARAHGVDTMFTLSGAHVFPLYDGAVKAADPITLLDVRHEQTAAFAAEATGKLTRVPGLAVLTAGPGVTNGLSAVAQAQFAGSPMVVVGGRAPQGRWGTGALQELDQPPIFAPVSKLARTIPTAGDVLDGMHDAFVTAGSSHRGPVFVDVPMDELFNNATGAVPTVTPLRGADPDPDAVAAIAALLAAASRPVLILGTDVWADHAEEAALRFVEAVGVPVITNGMGRGVVPGGHPLLVTKARSTALGGADLVVVVGTPLDFRLRSCTSPTRPANCPGTRPSPPRSPATSPRSSTDCRPASSTPYDVRTGPCGWATSSRPSPPPPNATGRCSAPKQIRSTPPGSTASCSLASPTTRW